MSKVSFLGKILKNKLLINLLIMSVIVAALIIISLVWMNMYTRHNESISVPNVKGMQVSQAYTFLASSGLKYEVVDSVFRRGGTPGGVIDQVPKANSQVKVGRTIFLTVQAVGKQTVVVPNLTDYSQRQAVSLLESLGFTNIQINEVDSEYKDLVLSVSYNNNPFVAGKKVPIDATVRLSVGNGMTQMPTDSIGAEEMEMDDLDVIDETY